MQSSGVDVLTVRSPSMTPTIMVGDRVLVDKAAYRLMLPFSSWLSDEPTRLTGPSLPTRGDIVAIRADDGSGHILIKRLIALPGDRVDIRSQSVRINGRPLLRHALSPKQTQALADRLARAHTPPPPGPTVWETLGRVRYQILLDDTANSRTAPMSRVIPRGYLYVLGDNRAASIDSRHWGPITVDRVLGHIVAL